MATTMIYGPRAERSRAGAKGHGRHGSGQPVLLSEALRQHESWAAVCLSKASHTAQCPRARRREQRRVVVLVGEIGSHAKSGVGLSPNDDVKAMRMRCKRARNAFRDWSPRGRGVFALLRGQVDAERCALVAERPDL